MTRVRPGRATRVLFKPLARPGRIAAGESINQRSALIDWAAYIDGERVDTASLAEAVTLVRAPDDLPEGAEPRSRFVWVGLHEPDAAELERLSEVFGLHPLAVEDAVHAHQRPKLERYDDVQFIVMKTVGYVERAGTETVRTGEIMIFCGPDFVVTVRHGEHGALAPVRQRLEDNPERLALGPAAVLHAIIDRVVDDYICVGNAVQQDIDEVEENVFSADATNQAERIYRLKREVIQLKRAVGPLSGPLRNLAARRFVPTEIREYFRDVDDHLARVREQVESCDELLTPILQAHLTQVTVTDNHDMRKISAWAAILAMPTAITGVYGMNFKYMPELHWKYGYLLAVGVIVSACFVLYRGFRRNGWL
ncbi:magnesium/cobalt transporter CorA [Actinoallomurus sp. WRP9H-5]|uniref:magnesium/cobalt transporter CorA n=1 Tax=Actinoallomurus rhizosphaericola TaxID=2952536 RepID=UPI00209288A6|nr:magnesium/cobalt transporter CorA [Actinoallomurus rhizosphaericola]MCO5997419.1 magnesium/cobalt transporter CorA [Actinoallomurus rhizosphaericola]